MDSTKRRAYLRAFWQLVVLLVIIFIIVYVLSFILDKIPPRYSKFIDAAAVALVAYLSVRILVSYLNTTLTGILGRTRVHPVIFVVRMIGYFVMALAILAALGIDVSSIILGSTFLAAVIGLASQSVLANQFAGLLLIITKPFKIGDRVWIHAWQFSIAYGVIAPKYYSSDFLYNNGFMGTVEDVSINYTTLMTEGGEIVKIANNVLTQGAFRNITREPVVQVRYEIPKYLDISVVKEKVMNALGNFEGAIEPITFHVDETTLNTYVILVKGKFMNPSPSAVRSRILEILISTIEPLRVGG